MSKNNRVSRALLKRKNAYKSRTKRKRLVKPTNS